MARGLLHCLISAKNSKCTVFGLTELWENAYLDNNRYHLGLIRRQANITATAQNPLSRVRLPITISSNILHCISIPTYAAELGVDPQADFAHRPESQGLLGSVFSCFPSGASRVLDRRTHREGYLLYILAENKLHQSKILIKNQPPVGVVHHLGSSPA